MPTATFLLIAARICVCGPAAEVEMRRDLEYARTGGHSLTLDAYLHRSSGPHPAILFVHGGGFVSGDKKDYPRDLLDPLLYAGFSILSVNYRLAPKNPFPAPTDDVENAIAWAKQNAAELRIDPKRLALLGPS